jgi:hypothetical protein
MGSPPWQRATRRVTCRSVDKRDSVGLALVFAVKPRNTKIEPISDPITHRDLCYANKLSIESFQMI